MAVDASMRKLKIPVRFIPYMEKHRIYELFHDLGNELAISRPPDPLKFLKTRLEQAERYRDKRLVIIIAPPFLDRIRLAHLIAVKTGFSVMSRYLCIKNPIDYYSPLILAKGITDQLNESDQKDWILADFPDTAKEAEELIIAGVLPTHTFLFLSEEGNYETEVEVKINKIDTTPSLLMDYDDNLFHLKELYKSSLKIVKIRGRSLEDLADACARLTKQIPSRHAPKLFRVVLLGPRGSRRRTLARLISRQLNVPHVDMEQLINVTRVSASIEGDELRYLDQNGYSYPLRTVFNLLKVRLAKEDCSTRGYVLTNFPTSVEDFVLLDSLETPPNRVIFLDIDETECQERLEDRVVNTHTGTLQSRRRDPMNKETLTHPDDDPCKVESEIRFYKERLGAMKKYCGETAYVVDGRGPINALLERIEGVLMGPAPVAKPRTGSIPRIELSQKSTESLLGHPPPPSRTEVVPMIESAELLRRFSDLKKRVQIRRDSSPTEGGDLIMHELNREFELSLRGGVFTNEDL